MSVMNSIPIIGEMISTTAMSKPIHLKNAKNYVPKQKVVSNSPGSVLLYMMTKIVNTNVV